MDSVRHQHVQHIRTAQSCVLRTIANCATLHSKQCWVPHNVVQSTLQPRACQLGSLENSAGVLRFRCCAASGTIRLLTTTAQSPARVICTSHPAYVPQPVYCARTSHSTISGVISNPAYLMFPICCISRYAFKRLWLALSCFSFVTGTPRTRAPALITESEGLGNTKGVKPPRACIYHAVCIVCRGGSIVQEGCEKRMVGNKVGKKGRW